MKKLPIIFLAIALVAFVIGFLETLRPGAWALGFPVGAVCLGLSFVTKVFQKEAARFDEEERQRHKHAERSGAA